MAAHASVPEWRHSVRACLAEANANIANIGCGHPTPRYRTGVGRGPGPGGMSPSRTRPPAPRSADGTEPGIVTTRPSKEDVAFGPLSEPVPHAHAGGTITAMQMQVHGLQMSVDVNRAHCDDQHRDVSALLDNRMKEMAEQIIQLRQENGSLRRAFVDLNQVQRSLESRAGPGFDSSDRPSTRADADGYSGIPREVELRFGEMTHRMDRFQRVLDERSRRIESAVVEFCTAHMQTEQENMKAVARAAAHDGVEEVVKARTQAIKDSLREELVDCARDAQRVAAAGGGATGQINMEAMVERARAEMARDVAVARREIEATVEVSRVAAEQALTVHRQEMEKQQQSLQRRCDEALQHASQAGQAVRAAQSEIADSGQRTQAAVTQRLDASLSQFMPRLEVANVAERAAQAVSREVEHVTQAVAAAREVNDKARADHRQRIEALEVGARSAAAAADAAAESNAAQAQSQVKRIEQAVQDSEGRMEAAEQRAAAAERSLRQVLETLKVVEARSDAVASDLAAQPWQAGLAAVESRCGQQAQQALRQAQEHTAAAMAESRAELAAQSARTREAAQKTEAEVSRRITDAVNDANQAAKATAQIAAAEAAQRACHPPAEHLRGVADTVMQELHALARQMQQQLQSTAAPKAVVAAAAKEAADEAKMTVVARTEATSAAAALREEMDERVLAQDRTISARIEEKVAEQLRRQASAVTTRVDDLAQSTADSLRHVNRGFEQLEATVRGHGRRVDDAAATVQRIEGSLATRDESDEITRKAIADKAAADTRSLEERLALRMQQSTRDATTRADTVESSVQALRVTVDDAHAKVQQLTSQVHQGKEAAAALAATVGNLSSSVSNITNVTPPPMAQQPASIGDSMSPGRVEATARRMAAQEVATVADRVEQLDHALRSVEQRVTDVARAQRDAAAKARASHAEHHDATQHLAASIAELQHLPAHRPSHHPHPHPHPQAAHTAHATVPASVDVSAVVPEESGVSSLVRDGAARDSEPPATAAAVQEMQDAQRSTVRILDDVAMRIVSLESAVADAAVHVARALQRHTAAYGPIATVGENCETAVATLLELLGTVDGTDDTATSDDPSAVGGGAAEVDTAVAVETLPHAIAALWATVGGMHAKEHRLQAIMEASVGRLQRLAEHEGVVIEALLENRRILETVAGHASLDVQWAVPLAALTASSSDTTPTMSTERSTSREVTTSS